MWAIAKDMGSFINNSVKISVFFFVPRIANTSEVRESGNSNRLANEAMLSDFFKKIYRLKTYT